MTRAPGYAAVRSALEREGLLLESDAALPSVAALVAGGPVHGSWWGHPSGRAIFAVLERLQDDPDVLAAKLVNGKVTLVHRRLFPALIGAATAGETWQTRGLAPAALALWRRVEDEGALRVDRLEPPEAGKRRPARSARSKAPRATALARALEQRLCVHGASVHTESGAHARELESWRCCAERVALAEPLLAGPAARARLDELGADLAQRSRAAVRFPWGEAPQRAR